MKEYNLILCLASVLTIIACTGKTEDEQPEKIIPVKIMNIASSVITAERNYVGTVEESFALSLSFSGMGVVEQVFVAEGEKVKEGQLLANINTATAQNAYDVSQASLRQAQDAYDRLSKLHANGSLPDVKFVEVETGLQQARSLAAISKKSLDDCRLYAPRSGVIAQRSIETGSNVMPGVAAFKLITLDKVKVKISVPEHEIASTSEGLEAIIEVPALDDETFSGKIEMKGVTANPLSHTYEVKIGIANNAGTLRATPLLPGMVCKVRLKQSDAQTSIIVPNRAVQISHDGKQFVWLAEGNTAKRRFVKTGTLSSFGVTVEDGLSGGEKLIVEGGQKVSEGMKVKPEL